MVGPARSPANGRHSLSRVLSERGDNLRDCLADPDRRTEALRAVASSIDFAEATCDLIGITAPIGTLFPTVLPPAPPAAAEAKAARERGQQPRDRDFRRLGRRARIEHDSKGRFVYRHVADDGSPIAKESWLLTEVYAALVSGRTSRLSSKQLPRWTVRLLIDIGFIELPTVEAGPRPDEIDPAAWARLLTFWSIRGWTDRNDAFPLTKQFLSDWCGLRSVRTAEEVLKVLRQEVMVATAIGPGKDNPGYHYRLRAHVPNGQVIEAQEGLVTLEFVAARNRDREQRQAATSANGDLQQAASA